MNALVGIALVLSALALAIATVTLIAVRRYAVYVVRMSEQLLPGPRTGRGARERGTTR